MFGIKKVNKWLSILGLMVLMSGLAFGAETGMKETSDYITGGAKIAGLIFIIFINLIWIIFPAGLAFMTYSYFKKKSEQAQEDMGLKAGISIFFSLIVGSMGAYFAVGSIGKMAGKKETLEDGNKYIVSSFLGAMVTNLASSLAP